MDLLHEFLNFLIFFYAKIALPICGIIPYLLQLIAMLTMAFQLR